MYIMWFSRDRKKERPFARSDAPDNIPNIAIYNTKEEVIDHLRTLAQKAIVDEEYDCILVYNLDEELIPKLIWGFWGWRYDSWHPEGWEQGFQFDLDDYQEGYIDWSEVKLNLYGDLAE